MEAVTKCKPTFKSPLTKCFTLQTLYITVHYFWLFKSIFVVKVQLPSLAKKCIFIISGLPSDANFDAQSPIKRLTLPKLVRKCCIIYTYSNLLLFFEYYLYYCVDVLLNLPIQSISLIHWSDRTCVCLEHISYG